MTLFAHFARGGGSLAALAVALAMTAPAAPAAAQEMTTFQADEREAPPPQRPTRVESSGGPARAEIYRPDPAPAPRYERPAPERQAPRFERAAEPQAAPPAPVFARQAPPMRVDPDIEARAALAQRADDRGGRRGRGGFGGDVITRAETVQREQQDTRRGDPRARQVDRRSEQRAEQIDRRSEQRAGQIDRRSERQADRVERRGDVRADQLDLRGRDAAADRVDRRTDIRSDRIEDRGDRRADRVEDRGDRRADRVEDRGDRRVDRVEGRRDDSWGGGIRDLAREGRRDEWRGDRDGRRDDWRSGRDGRRDEWRGDRRDDRRAERRDWRRDDWRWGWNGRSGWDNRDFRRWDNRWRDNRSYNWSGYRRSHRVIYQPGPYFAPYRSHRYNRLSIGLYLDSLFFQPRFFINDPWAYRLPPAYGPYQWVRYYDDVLLVDIYSGEVVDVINDFFW